MGVDYSKRCFGDPGYPVHQWDACVEALRRCSILGQSSCYTEQVTDLQKLLTLQENHTQDGFICTLLKQTLKKPVLVKSEDHLTCENNMHLLAFCSVYEDHASHWQNRIKRHLN